MGAGLGAWSVTRSGEPRAASTAPNVVLILTDDQRWDTLAAMPTVQRELAGRGVAFANAFVVNPLCCPSRASTLTGGYSHSTGVYLNTGPRGLPALRDESTLATWLDDAGYETAFVGKYLNGYARTDPPPGWDRWVAFTGTLKKGVPPNYFGYELSVDGEREAHGFAPEDYSTDVLARRAAEFVREADGPLFLVFAPFAPHPGPSEEDVTTPATPAPRHAGAFADLQPWRPPNFDESDLSDKPTWLRARAPLGDAEAEGIDGLRRSQLSSLLAVDDAVGSILRALRETSRLRNTLVLYTADNGQSWGEHRWRGKGLPYEEDIRVPLLVRYDRLGMEPRSEERLALNIDLAPTIADLTGVETPRLDGSSLLPLLSETAPPWREDFLVEHYGAPPAPAVPSYCAVRSETHTYVAYATGDEELYNLVDDPFQLENRAGKAEFRDALEGMRARVRELCSPLPPRFGALP